MPKSWIGWIVLIIVVVVIWRNPAATGHFLFTTLPAKISAFFGNV
jgi:hypothetical protein